MQNRLQQLSKKLQRRHLSSLRSSICAIRHFREKIFFFFAFWQIALVIIFSFEFQCKMMIYNVINQQSKIN